MKGVRRRCLGSSARTSAWVRSSREELSATGPHAVPIEERTHDNGNGVVRIRWRPMVAELTTAYHHLLGDLASCAPTDRDGLRGEFQWQLRLRCLGMLDRQSGDHRVHHPQGTVRQGPAFAAGDLKATLPPGASTRAARKRSSLRYAPLSGSVAEAIGACCGRIVVVVCGLLRNSRTLMAQ